MGWMQTTCREAARLMSARRDEPLGAWQGLALRLHMRLCGDCREVGRQIDQLGDLSADLWGGARIAGRDHNDSSDDKPAQR